MILMLSNTIISLITGTRIIRLTWYQLLRLISQLSVSILVQRVVTNKYKDIKELPEGATIAIPNDAVNESRALNLLQSAGLIKLSVGANDKAKLTDVSENSKNLNIREVDAAQTAANIDSVDAAIINK
ncbi:ABC transporter substrate-binding protein [Streptococcus thermophilus CNCM I-1630]|nr:ABC transporter substrate-binding protein [Streptococcus thermophilus CNCM I-1630]